MLFRNTVYLLSGDDPSHTFVDVNAIASQSGLADVAQIYLCMAGDPPGRFGFLMLSFFERRIDPEMSVLMDRMRAVCLRARGARLGEKVRVGPRCTVQIPWGLTTGVRCQFEHDVFIKIVDGAAQVFLGDEVFLGRGVEFDISLRLTIGNHVLIAPGCFITDHAHRHAIGTTIASQGCVSGAVTIGDDVWLGVNTVVLAGVTIGAGAVVGAGSVVTRDVAPMTVVVGAPARPVSRRTVT